MTTQKSYNSAFLITFLSIAAPIALQQIISISLNLIDNLMVGRLGVLEIAAVGFANRVNFFLLLSLFGAVGGSGILISQYFGQKNFTRIKQSVGFSMIAALSFATITFLASTLASDGIIGLFSDDPEVIDVGSSFLFIVAFSFPLIAISITITSALRSIGETKSALYITAFVASLNTLLNYILIYGHFGSPALGANGAAIGTVIARFVEASIFIKILKNKKYNLFSSIKDSINIDAYLLKKIIKISYPIFLTEFVWVIGTISLTAAYAILGTEAAAVATIAELPILVSTVFFVAIATASSVLIAQSLGEVRVRKAFHMSTKIIYIAIFFGIILLTINILIIPLIIYAYNLTDLEIIKDAKLALLVMSFAVMFKVINWTMLIGILRAGGDTLVAFLIDIIPLICLGVPLAFILSIYTTLPVYVIMAIVNIEEVIKMIVTIKRYRSLKWINILVDKR